MYILFRFADYNNKVIRVDFVWQSLLKIHLMIMQTIAMNNKHTFLIVCR